MKTIDRIQEVASQVSKDCENDALTLDGLPFNGKTVAKRLGEIYAMVQALANGMVVVCEQLKSDQTDDHAEGGA